MTAELKKETESARSHNIDAEEVMGMFSAAKQCAPNATLCFLSSRMKAKKIEQLITWMPWMWKKESRLLGGQWAGQEREGRPTGKNM